MIDFKTLLHSETGFIPRTEAQALQGFSEGILNPEYYIYRAVNIHPILEEPWDVHEMDRLLAQPDLDIETAVILMAAFERMIQDQDKELALFAAESINALERKFITRIQGYRTTLETMPEPGLMRNVIKEYRSLARLHTSRPVLRSFYLEEARLFFEEHKKSLVDPDVDITAFIEILLDLKLVDRASRIIRNALKHYPDNRNLRYLAARSAYLEHRFSDVIKHMELLVEGSSDDTYAALQLFWTSGACRG